MIDICFCSLDVIFRQYCEEADCDVNHHNHIQTNITLERVITIPFLKTFSHTHTHQRFISRLQPSQKKKKKES